MCTLDIYHFACGHTVDDTEVQRCTNAESNNLPRCENLRERAVPIAESPCRECLDDASEEDQLAAALVASSNTYASEYAKQYGDHTSPDGETEDEALARIMKQTEIGDGDDYDLETRIMQEVMARSQVDWYAHAPGVPEQPWEKRPIGYDPNEEHEQSTPIHQSSHIPPPDPRSMPSLEAFNPRASRPSAGPSTAGPSSAGPSRAGPSRAVPSSSRPQAPARADSSQSQARPSPPVRAESSRSSQVSAPVPPPPPAQDIPDDARARTRDVWSKVQLQRAPKPAPATPALKPQPQSSPAMSVVRQGKAPARPTAAPNAGRPTGPDQNRQAPAPQRPSAMSSVRQGKAPMRPDPTPPTARPDLPDGSTLGHLRQAPSEMSSVRQGKALARPSPARTTIPDSSAPASRTAPSRAEALMQGSAPFTPPPPPQQVRGGRGINITPLAQVQRRNAETPPPPPPVEIEVEEIVSSEESEDELEPEVGSQAMLAKRRAIFEKRKE